MKDSSWLDPVCGVKRVPCTAGNMVGGRGNAVEGGKEVVKKSTCTDGESVYDRTNVYLTVVNDPWGIGLSGRHEVE